MKSKLFKITLIFAGLIAGLLLIEGGLRIAAFILKRPTVFYIETGNIYKYNPIWGWELIPNTQSEIRTLDYNVIYKINANGFRDDKNYSFSKKIKRIAVLGDSFTFGIGVDNNKTFSKILEEKSGCEVLNMGVSGYSPSQYLLGLEKKGLKYNPDAVIVSIYTGNDIYDTGLAQKTTGLRRNKPYFNLEDGKLILKGVPVPKKEEFFDISMNNYVKNQKFYNDIQWFVKWKIYALIKIFLKEYTYSLWEKLGVLNSVEDYEDSLQIIGATLDRARTDLDNLGGKRKLVVLIIPPSGIKYGRLQRDMIKRLVQILEEKKITYINLLPEVLKSKNLYFSNDGHFNEKGQYLAAEELYKVLHPLIDCKN